MYRVSALEARHGDTGRPRFAPFCPEPRPIGRWRGEVLFRQPARRNLRAWDRATSEQNKENEEMEAVFFHMIRFRLRISTVPDSAVRHLYAFHKRVLSD